ncbi:aminomethyltransferase beta-barrel domain-containing protein [Mobilicoccus caccae]|uniref:aminomethyltransferase beta-barrel domain-containing protein n=1 Tax=Mobilicoccus caccae TaxID=1859295 RepID=UPI003D66CA8E
MLTIDVIEGENARWCGPPPQGRVTVGAQVRAHGRELPATAEATEDGGVLVHLDERERGVAAGQSVVLYDGTRVIGSATITATRRATASTSSA